MAYANGYTYKRVIAVDHTKVPSALTDYPLLVKYTHGYLRSTAHGGRVINGAHLDIRFETTDGVKLAHEIERYIDTTGEIIAHVKVPSISSTSDTRIEMYYGKTGVSDEQDLPVLWSDYEFVWHGNSLTESKGVTFTNTGSTDAVGAIGQGRAFDGTQRVNTSLATRIDTAALTWELICNPVSVATTQIFASISSQTYFRILSGNFNASVRLNGSQTVIGGPAVAMSPNLNNHLCVTYDGSVLRTYRNAIAGATNATAGVAELLAGHRTIGGYNNTNSNPFAGVIDEYRLSQTQARSADWVIAQYQNHSDPESFYTMGSEQAVGADTGVGFLSIM